MQNLIENKLTKCKTPSSKPQKRKDRPKVHDIGLGNDLLGRYDIKSISNKSKTRQMETTKSQKLMCIKGHNHRV